MNWSIENVEASNGGCSGQGVGVEELWLSLSSVSTFSVPPLRSIAVQSVAAVAGYNDVLS